MVMPIALPVLLPFNEKLSQARAERVAGLLVKMGVDKDNIIVKSNGGVKDIGFGFIQSSCNYSDF